MRCEWPALTKCCFCIPLRKGLLAWGYLKLAFTLFIFFVSVVNFIHIQYYHGHNISPLGYAIMIVFFIVNLIDVIFQVTFIVSAHKKNHKYMKWYGHYTLALVCVVGVTSFCYLCFLIVELNEYIFFLLYIPWFAPTVLMLLLYFSLHTYVLILVRNEVNKLENNTQFEFVNRAEEEKCNAVTHVSNPQDV